MQDDFSRLNLELDRKNAELEESLSRQEEMGGYLSSILESLYNGVVAIDNAGAVTIFNKAASLITGFSTESVIGKNYRDVFTVADGEGCAATMLDNGQSSAQGEKVLWGAGRAPVPVSFQCALLKDRGNRTLGAVEVFNDISRIKALEAEMQNTRTMAAIGEMAATVAHEIRNPLGAMGVWAGLLDRDFDREDRRRDTLAKIIDALGRLNRIVSNLLVYSRPVRAQFREIVLQDILTETINYVEVEALRLGQPIAVECLFDPLVRTVILADPEKLQQAVLNLSLNALQAMPEGGKLTVDCVRDGEYARVSIADTGTGIDEEKIQKIFDPFFTTKENGTGLGLAIVRKFIEFHSGFIHVKSELGEGTVFDVFLPHLRTD